MAARKKQRVGNIKVKIAKPSELPKPLTKVEVDRRLDRAINAAAVVFGASRVEMRSLVAAMTEFVSDAQKIAAAVTPAIDTPETVAYIESVGKMLVKMAKQRRRREAAARAVKRMKKNPPAKRRRSAS